MSAATDNIGLFFGEDIFMAIGSILLIVGFLASERHRRRAAAPVGLGHPDGHRRLRDPRRAAAAVRPPAAKRGAMIKPAAVYVLAGLMFAAFALFSARPREPKRWATPPSGAWSR
jgi:hypothetical protein